MVIRFGWNADEQSVRRPEREGTELRERVTGRLPIVVSKFTAKFKVLRATPLETSMEHTRDGVHRTTSSGNWNFRFASLVSA